MEKGLTSLEIIIEVYDDSGRFEGEWDYTISRESLEEWEAIDIANFDEGRRLVRYLLLTKLREHSPLCWSLLINNTDMTEFLDSGVPSDIVAEIPRLSTLNIAADRVYDCLSSLVLEEDIRMAH